MKHVALTTDGWTSCIGDPYITVTVHYVSSNFKMMARVLNTSYLPVSHTSANIADHLKSIASKWNIENKIVAVVTDNAANMKEAVRLCGWRNVNCFAHTLNLVVTDAIDRNPEFKLVLSSCRAVVTYFKQSPKANTKLKEMSVGNSIKTLKQEVPTRWNSSLTMLRSIVALSDQVNATLALLKRTDLILDAPTINLIKVKV